LEFYKVYILSYNVTSDGISFTYDYLFYSIYSVFIFLKVS